MILKLGMKHQGIELYKVYINHYPTITLTYFIEKQFQRRRSMNFIIIYACILPRGGDRPTYFFSES